MSPAAALVIALAMAPGSGGERVQLASASAGLELGDITGIATVADADVAGGGGGGVPLSAEDAVRVALERSGEIMAASIDAQIDARGRALELENPTVRLGHRSFDGLFGQPHQCNANWCTELAGRPLVDYAPLDDSYIALGWDLPKPVEIVSLLRESHRAAADRADVVELERDLGAAVRLLHARVLALRAEFELARRALDIAAQVEQQSQARLQASAATTLDMRLAGLEKLDAATDAAEVQNDALRAEHELAGLTGLQAPLSLAAPPTSLCAPPSGNIDQLLVRAREHSAKLKKHQAKREAAAHKLAWSWLPWLPYVEGMQIGYYDEPLTEIDAIRKRDQVRAQIDIALPIFAPFGSEGTVAQLEKQRADALYAEEERQIDARVRGAVNRLERALTLVQLYEKDGDTVEQSLAEVQRALDAGQADLARVSEVQRRAVRGRRNLLRARFRCEEAVIELRRVTGDDAVASSAGAAAR